MLPFRVAWVRLVRRRPRSSLSGRAMDQKPGDSSFEW
jgi:hypothetical protein